MTSDGLIRKRSRNTVSGSLVRSYKSSTGNVSDQSFHGLVGTKEYCEDYPHNNIRKGKIVGGSPLYLTRENWQHIPTDGGRVYRAGYWNWYFDGPFVVGSAYRGSQPSLADVNALLPPASTLGAEALSRFKPGKPVFSGLNSLYELKDIPGLIQMMRHGLRDFRRAKITDYGTNAIPSGPGRVSGGYLAYEFGIAPLLSDLRKLYSLQIRLHRALERLKKDNGKLVRRQGELRLLTSTSGRSQVRSYSGFDQQFVSQMHWYEPFIWRETTTYAKAWFSGRFRYWVPDIGTPQWTARAKRYLSGISLSPVNLYNAIPWTWLIDWFSNLEFVIDNLTDSAAENLVWDYAYIMRHVQKQYRCEVEGGFYSTGTYPHPANGRVVRRAFFNRNTEVKTRTGATPFGFGLKQTDLSDRQLAILAALGLNRVF